MAAPEPIRQPRADRARHVADVLRHQIHAGAYDDGLPPHHPLYDGTPWFMPVLGSWYQFQDRRERRAA